MKKISGERNPHESSNPRRGFLMTVVAGGAALGVLNLAACGGGDDEPAPTVRHEAIDPSFAQSLALDSPMRKLATGFAFVASSY